MQQEGQERARIDRLLADPAPSPGGEVAPVASAALDEEAEQPVVALRFAWGLALLVASTVVMLVDSLYLTFVAQRAGERS